MTTLVGGIDNAGTGGGGGTVTNTSGNLTNNAVVLGNGTNDIKTVTAFTTDGAAQMTVGVAGGGNGVLALSGNTSGAATLTAPAVAGTSTNPITSSNVLTLPVGAAATPSVLFGANTCGLFSSGAAIVSVARTSNANLILELNAGGTAGGQLLYTSGSSTTTLRSGSGANANTPLIVQGANTNGPNITAVTITTAGSAIPTSGTAVLTGVTGTFAPTSGTAAYNALLVNPTINQTGGANGNYTALKVNAVETALGGSSNLLLDLQSGTSGGVSRFSVDNSGQTLQTTANGAQWIQGQASELLTLSTVGTTTDTAANLLPANSIIESVVARVTTTITTATTWQLGDATTANRFTAANSSMTAGTTDIGLRHQQGSITTDAAGPVQTAAAKVRVTTTGTPGAGVVRITVFYRQFVAPTS